MIMDELHEFIPVRKSDMAIVMPYLELEQERTCDFSYGGVLMWTDYYDYEYAICADTLFMRGNNPENPSQKAYTFPLGKLPLAESLNILTDYCKSKREELVFASVPEEAKNMLMAHGATEATELTDYGDYIYEASALAELKGKKMSKKRNHVHQFMAACPDWSYEALHASHIPEIREITMREISHEASQSEAAKNERKLALNYLYEFEDGNPHMAGGVLKSEGKIVGYTIGDIKGDTLYVHIEKAERSIPGSFEAINKMFAEDVIAHHPEVKYINREDDAGDEGLRGAKMSYHPIQILKKYMVRFS